MTLLALAQACAGGGTGRDAGGTTDGGDVDVDGGGADAGVDGGPADAGIDAPDMRRGFGEPCSDRGECTSGICLVVGTGGFCSELCTAGTCPDGFGCVSVRDATEFSPFSDVCVPETTTLCTPCDEDTECAVLGSDLCLPRMGSERFCAQDCSTVGCPTGYRCEQVEIEGTRYEQCLPTSGSCECGAATEGLMQGCTIETLFGRTCAGSRACRGALGWGSCEAPTVIDEPDPSFEDTNCDGIDGDASRGIFVAVTVGTDNSTCGLAPASPCRSLQHAITRATSEGRTDLFVMAGSYTGVVRLTGGIRIFGGYDATWLRRGRGAAGHTVTLEGGIDAGEGEYIAVLAHDLDSRASLADLVIVGPNAVGAREGRGLGSYGVHVRDGAGVRLERVTVRGGNGATGPTGDAGADAPNVSATAGMNGGTGGEARRFTTACNASSRGEAGTAGANSCSGGRNPTAGAGGAGGTMDRSCPCVVGSCFTASAGDNGNNATVFATSSYGYRGAGGAGASTCAQGGPANAGSIINGGPGAPGMAGGLLVSAYWYGQPGGTGGVGDNGTGGGGGGGSGGCDSGTDAYGAGGGGGGAGGCRAQSGGTGGGGGGGSFGVFVVRSSAELVDCEIIRGNGGDGGVGGAGGRGQSGGAVGPGGGGAGSGSAGPGGNGGAGGHGGHGGGGGGGAGGDSWGVYSFGSTVDASSAVVSGGAAGRGGAGGASAPAAPVAERDGNPGMSGGNGALGTIGTCANPSAC